MTPGFRTPLVEALFVHPIKSAAAIPVDVLDLDDRGAIGDRRWLVVDADGMQITARETPRLALVRPTFVLADPELGARRNTDGALSIDAPNMPTMFVDIPHTRHTRPVKIWNDTVDAHDAGNQMAEWFSAVLGRDCRLVRISEDARRPLAPKFAGPLSYAERRVAFSDGAPLLLLGQASIDALSTRLVEQGNEPMTVARFRPNILISHTTAHEEDTWDRVRIGNVSMGVGAQCIRCVMTTVNPLTAEKGVEPLRMLSTYRRQENHVVFGMNATHAAPGTIWLGDRVTVETRRSTVE